VDAITGEGLCLTFHQASALARCLDPELDARGEAGSLAGYAEEHGRLRRRPALMADLLLMMDQRAWLRRRALHALSARQGTFSGMVAMHVGALRPAEFAAHFLALGWGLLTCA
jgi:hypothetical protein